MSTRFKVKSTQQTLDSHLMQRRDRHLICICIRHYDVTGMVQLGGPKNQCKANCSRGISMPVDTTSIKSINVIGWVEEEAWQLGAPIFHEAQGLSTRVQPFPMEENCFQNN